METIEFMTFKKNKYNPENCEDSAGIVFTVPKEWAEKKIKEMFGISIQEFYANYYNWNHTEILYYLAEDEEVLL
ncbi:MAG: hypothetical protein K9L17_09990 [Clostridiales bacterium]|nr:hypothetical protein [Clostridiales bacterium]MCF8023010.1 hypothetical protein [Clostridiales bacterium]